MQFLVPVYGDLHSVSVGLDAAGCREESADDAICIFLAVHIPDIQSRFGNVALLSVFKQDRGQITTFGRLRYCFLQSRKSQHGRHDIDCAQKCRIHPVPYPVRISDQERDVEGFRVDGIFRIKCPLAAHGFPMVGSEHHDGILFQPETFQFCASSARSRPNSLSTPVTFAK